MTVGRWEAPQDRQAAARGKKDVGSTPEATTTAAISTTNVAVLAIYLRPRVPSNLVPRLSRRPVASSCPARRASPSEGGRAHRIASHPARAAPPSSPAPSASASASAGPCPAHPARILPQIFHPRDLAGPLTAAGLPCLAPCRRWATGWPARGLQALASARCAASLALLFYACLPVAVGRPTTIIITTVSRGNPRSSSAPSLESPPAGQSHILASSSSPLCCLRRTTALTSVASYRP